MNSGMVYNAAQSVSEYHFFFICKAGVERWGGIEKSLISHIGITPSLAFKGHGIQGSLVKPYVVNQGI